MWRLVWSRAARARGLTARDLTVNRFPRSSTRGRERAASELSHDDRTRNTRADVAEQRRTPDGHHRVRSSGTLARRDLLRQRAPFDERSRSDDLAPESRRLA